MTLEDSIIPEIAANPARFTIVGETHPDETIETLIDALIGTGNYETLYLEALDMGNYEEEGDKLKREGGVYSHNPAKYDRIIRHAIGKGMDVRGIGGNRKDTNEDTARWADYILSTNKGKCLVLTGTGHVNYWHDYDEQSQLLPAHIAGKGIPVQEIITIPEYRINQKAALKSRQIYRSESLPWLKEFGNYIFVRAYSQREEEFERGIMMENKPLKSNFEEFPLRHISGIQGGRHDA